jgi:hypothetical protein
VPELEYPTKSSLEYLAVDVVSAREVWTLGSNAYTDYKFLERVDGGRRRSIFEWNHWDYPADLAVVGRNDVWLVGEKNLHPLVFDWDGTRVTETTPFPSLHDTTLNAVSALSATDVWAAGEHLIARYSC